MRIIWLLINFIQTLSQKARQVVVLVWFGWVSRSLSLFLFLWYVRWVKTDWRLLTQFHVDANLYTLLICVCVCVYGCISIRLWLERRAALDSHSSYHAILNFLYRSVSWAELLSGFCALICFLFGGTPNWFDMHSVIKEERKGWLVLLNLLMNLNWS